MKTRKILGLMILSIGLFVSAGISISHLVFSVGTTPIENPPSVTCTASPSSPVDEGTIVTFSASANNFNCEGQPISYTWSGQKAGANYLNCPSAPSCTGALYDSVSIRSATDYDLGVKAECGGQSAFSYCTVVVNTGGTTGGGTTGGGGATGHSVLKVEVY